MNQWDNLSGDEMVELVAKEAMRDIVNIRLSFTAPVTSSTADIKITKPSSGCHFSPVERELKIVTENQNKLMNAILSLTNK